MLDRGRGPVWSKRLTIVIQGVSGEPVIFRVACPTRCIQIISAKFGSFPVENRFRQPASPLLTGSDSSQQTIQKKKGNTNGNWNSEVV